MLLPAGPIPRCAAERICLGGRLEPRVRSPPAASHEAAAGLGHPEHGVPLHQPAEHVCLQQCLLVHGYAALMHMMFCSSDLVRHVCLLARLSAALARVAGVQVQKSKIVNKPDLTISCQLALSAVSLLSDVSWVEACIVLHTPAGSYCCS